MDKITDQQLYDIAEKAREKAYAPYSGFRVGAALLASDGRVFEGVNVENASYGATICAERTAFVKAISEGERSFEAIAVSAGDSPAFPCGICRQFMSEFAPEITIVTKADGQFRIRNLTQLLPESFQLNKEEQESVAAVESAGNAPMQEEVPPAEESDPAVETAE